MFTQDQELQCVHKGHKGTLRMSRPIRTNSLVSSVLPNALWKSTNVYWHVCVYSISTYINIYMAFAQVCARVCWNNFNPTHTLRACGQTTTVSVCVSTTWTSWTSCLAVACACRGNRVSSGGASCEEPSGRSGRSSGCTPRTWRAWRRCASCSDASARPSGRSASRSPPRYTGRASPLQEEEEEEERREEMKHRERKRVTNVS